MPSATKAFDLLHPTIRNWVADKRWTELRDIQEKAIPILLDRKHDVIISATTASGKTEAAFLPILTDLMKSEPEGIGAVYLSPLKALINDQFRRIELLCDKLEMPVHKWHGDVGAGSKKKALKSRGGILLITPESLEALFVLRAGELKSLFGSLRFVVVDELHSFIGSERGRQLQSLLDRIQQLTPATLPRVGLSATLGDVGIASRFLRLSEPERVIAIDSQENGRELRLQVRGYRDGDPNTETPVDEKQIVDAPLAMFSAADLDIARDLFTKLRGGKHLVFANARASVEFFADTLRDMSEKARLPNEFFPHHGNLSKELREDVETRLREDGRPTTAVCTSTLEMGIDIKQVQSVAQIGAPHSVSSLRQRLGRSGRTDDEPSTLRMFIEERTLGKDNSLADRLRIHLFQAIAIVELMLEKWCEPPAEGALHLSTFVQQILSIVAGRGGARATTIHSVLCDAGPFTSIGHEDFVALLRELGRREILMQSSDGTLLTGRVGERITSHFSFYAAFWSPEEYRLVANGEPLGTMPVDRPLAVGAYLIFGGRRWAVLEMDVRQRVIWLEPAPGKNLPKFSSAPGLVHARIRQKMFELYKSFEVPRYLDATAIELLSEGRQNFAAEDLGRKHVSRDKDGAAAILWAGDRVVNTLCVALRAMGLPVESFGGIVTVSRCSVAELQLTLEELASGSPPDPIFLASTVTNKIAEKYDELLPEDLLCSEYAARSLASEELQTALQCVLPQ